MKIICDTHVLLFWANDLGRLTLPARKALEANMDEGTLGCADITLWEIALLHERGRLSLPSGVTPESYMHGIIRALRLNVLAITPDIAALSRSELFCHQDPADRLIAATAIVHQASLISADKKLAALPQLRIIW